MMRRDYFRLKRNQKKQIVNSVEKSIDLRRSRLESAARMNLRAVSELPIAEKSEELVTLIKENQVVILAGETGSGKTTQLPKLCLQAGFGLGGKIGHTQPRRVAARTVAKRIASETGSQLGVEVGYSVRFSDQTSDSTLVKIMTDGILLSEISRDRFLDEYEVLIIDEAHERSLNIDFLLGYLKRLLKKRTDLKVIVTSATINLEHFSAFFDNAPVIEISGRSYPVELDYRDDEDDIHSSIVNILGEILRAPVSKARDTLVFLAGEREIFETAKILRQIYDDQFEVLPLYSRLSLAEQEKIFTTVGRSRRVILATNVAETSITVPNIGYVIDPGSARINRYSYRSKLERLPIEPISQASADQRKGRCGRVAPGICYRLYGESDFLSRPMYTDPEIKRVNLASVVLQMEGLGLGDIDKFPFVEPPEAYALKDAYRLLDELGAYSSGKVNNVGRQMARIPVDPRLARMLLEAGQFGGLKEALIIVAALSVPDPRERPFGKIAAADQAHEIFSDEQSDFLSQLKLWSWMENHRQQLTRNKWRKLLVKHFVSYLRIQEWREVHRQLKSVCLKDLKFKVNIEPANYQLLHENILVGCLSLIARHEERGEYLGARNLKARIFPGSALAKKNSKWIVASEIVETSRVYARRVAKIDPAWLEKKAKHLVKYSDTEPTWSKKRGETIAYRTLTLYGLKIVEKRTISYTSTAPSLSRKMFISEGLVNGLLLKIPEFVDHNLALVKEVKEVEEKQRQRDILIEDEILEEFYDSKLPDWVRCQADLQKWLRRAGEEVVRGLFFSKDMLVKSEINTPDDLYPKLIKVGGSALNISYAFAPGQPDDGVSVEVPVGFLRSLGSEPFEWLVPGMLESVIEFWLRSLPKKHRKMLLPIPEKSEELSSRLVKPEIYRQGRLLSKLGDLIKNYYGVSVEASDWDHSRIPEHLTPNFRIMSREGSILSENRDLQQLKKIHSGKSTLSVNSEIAAHSIVGLVEFPNKGLLDSLTLDSRSGEILVYPGLQDDSASVSLKYFATPEERDSANRSGYARLALLRVGKRSRFFQNELKKRQQVGLLFSTLGDWDQLKEQVLLSAAWNCYFEGNILPKTAKEFQTFLSAKQEALVPVFYKTLDLFSKVIELRFEIVNLLESLGSVAYEPSRQHMMAALEELVPSDFLLGVPGRYVRLLPRYLEGLKYRANALEGRVFKDRDLMQGIVSLENRLQKIKKSELFSADRYSFLRFYLEEYKLNVFAHSIAKQGFSDHPIDLGKYKPSAKRFSAELREEEQRLGLV